jgi:hypothetical protein
MSSKWCSEKHGGQVVWERRLVLQLFGGTILPSRVPLTAPPIYEITQIKIFYLKFVDILHSLNEI